MNKIFKALLCLVVAHNFASDGVEVILVMPSGRELNLAISERKMHEARACVANPGEAFRGFLRQKIPGALIDSDYEGLIPNSLCMSIKEFNGSEDLEVPEGDDKPVMGRLVILSDICRCLEYDEKKKLGFIYENSDSEDIVDEDSDGEECSERVRMIPGIGALMFNKSLGTEDLRLDELLAMGLSVCHSSAVCIGFNMVPQHGDYDYPVFNQGFAEFLRAAAEPLERCRNWSGNYPGQTIFSACGVFPAMCMLYTGQDVEEIDEVTAGENRAAREILAGLGLPPYIRAKTRLVNKAIAK